MTDKVKDGAIEVTIYSDNRDTAALDAVTAAFARYDGNDVDYVTATGDLDDTLREAVTRAADTAGKDLIVVITDGVHDDRTSATTSLQELADDNNFVVFVLTGEPNDDVAAYLDWADNKAPFADNVDVLRLDELPGDEVDPWAQRVLAAV